MKILQLTVHFSPNVGGVETHLDDLVNGLIQKKNDVFVLTYRPLMQDVDWKICERKNGLEVLRIPWIKGLFYKYVQHPVLEFIYLTPALFVITPFIVLSKKIQVIHSHGLIAGFVGTFWGKILKTRVITTTHSIYNFSKKGFYRNFAKWIFNNSDVVLTLSKQSKNEIENLGISEDKIKVFTYWVDLDIFKKILTAKRDLSWSDKFVVLFVGRLVAEKGIKELLGTAQIWNKNITLAIIGNGPVEEDIRKIKRNNLIYLGKVENNKLPLYYSAADLLIVPSVSEEGFGRVILESLSCGTPVIGSRRGAIPEAMNETVGKLIKVTPQNIKESVEYFYKNPIKLRALSKNARAFAEKRYSSNNLTAILLNYSPS